MCPDAPQSLLHAEEVVRTIDRLALRIAERFPGSSLSGVCRQLLAVARQAKARSALIARPVWSLRLLTVLVILLILGGSAGVWQKIMILHSLDGQREQPRVPVQDGTKPSAK